MSYGSGRLGLAQFSMALQEFEDIITSQVRDAIGGMSPGEVKAKWGPAYFQAKLKLMMAHEESDWLCSMGDTFSRLCSQTPGGWLCDRCAHDPMCNPAVKDEAKPDPPPAG